MKALIIDDEIDICYLLRSILLNKNISSEYVNSITEARRVLLNTNPEIIFLDNHLPDSKGVEFISYLKKNHPGSIVVMITAYDTPDDRKKALMEGANLFISKPFSRETILRTIDFLLHQFPS
ncbi:response regulator [Ferruginibacter profundus]